MTPADPGAVDPGRLAALQRQAGEQGRRCVVSAVIVAGGKVFVQQRAPHVRLFPGCWDIVGGHVEPGETLEQALSREVAEETGWRLVTIIRLLEVLDWAGGHGSGRRREFDFLVEVEGDLANPRLEAGKFSRAGWVDEEGLAALLAEDPGDGAMLEVAAAGLRSAADQGRVRRRAWPAR